MIKKVTLFLEGRRLAVSSLVLGIAMIGASTHCLAGTAVSELKPIPPRAFIPETILSDLDLPVVYFTLDGHDLTPPSKKDLEALIDILKKYPNMQVEVRGHADASGSADYNLELSLKRANQVVDYLIGQGIPRDQLTARPFGESMPIADNGTEESRRLNRRVTFFIKKY